MMYLHLTHRACVVVAKGCLKCC